MAENKQYTELLLETLRCELWQRPFPHKKLSDDEMKFLLDEGERQTVAGLVASTLMQNSVELGVMNVLEMMSFVRQIQGDNTKLNDDLLRFARAMTGGGLDFIVVKGQTLAALYPHPDLRTAGDVDFYCPGFDYRTQKAQLESILGIELPRNAPRKETGFDWGEGRFELHNQLLLLAYPPHRKYWKKALAESVQKNHRVKIEDTDIHTLDPALNVAYTFAHLFIHFVKEGIGLRHLCDLAVIVHHYHKDIDGNTLKTMLQRMGLLKAFMAFGHVLKDYLDMPVEDFPFPLDQRYRRYSKKLMDDILYSGNFAKTVREETHSKSGYKWVTFKMMARRCWKYFRLAPLECTFFVPNYIQTNLWELRRGE